MEKEQFIGYEYKDVTARSSMVPITIDGYESFGWELTEQSKIQQEKNASRANLPQHERLRFRRDRHITNRVELTRLERNLEAVLDEIERLEDKKTIRGTMASIILGLVGCGFLAAGLMAYLSDASYVMLMVILAIPGFLCWVFPYFVYQKIRKLDTERLDPIIDGKYEEIYDLCKRGHELTD